jgi:hypothetical protein
MSQTQLKGRSEMNHFNDPTGKPPVALVDLFNDGPLKSMVIRKLRSSVTNILRSTLGEGKIEEQAADHYGYFIDWIIRTSLKKAAPTVYSRAITDDQSEKIKKQFPAQIEFVDKVIERINKGYSLEKIISLSSL